MLRVSNEHVTLDLASRQMSETRFDVLSSCTSKIPVARPEVSKGQDLVLSLRFRFSPDSRTGSQWGITRPRRWSLRRGCNRQRGDLRVSLFAFFCLLPFASCPRHLDTPGIELCDSAPFRIGRPSLQPLPVFLLLPLFWLSGRASLARLLLLHLLRQPRVTSPARNSKYHPPSRLWLPSASVAISSLVVCHAFLSLKGQVRLVLSKCRDDMDLSYEPSVHISCMASLFDNVSLPSIA